MTMFTQSTTPIETSRVYKVYVADAGMTAADAYSTIVSYLTVGELDYRLIRYSYTQLIDGWDDRYFIVRVTAPYRTHWALEARFPRYYSD